MNKAVYIYALAEPGSAADVPALVRYVGMSQGPEVRLQQHLDNKNGDPGLRAWLDTLRHRGEWPELHILEESDSSSAREAEAAQIRRHVEAGAILFNRTRLSVSVTAGMRAHLEEIARRDGWTLEGLIRHYIHEGAARARAAAARQAGAGQGEEEGAP